MAVAMAFFAQGFCFAALLTQTNVLKDRFEFSDGQLSLVLLVVPVVAGVGSVLAGVAAARLGSGIVLRAGGVLVALAVAGTGAADERIQLYLALAALGIGLGSVDAAMNMQGYGVERRYGRPVLSSLHGVWSVGAMAGALTTAATSELDFTTFESLGTAAVIGAAIALSAGPLLLRRSELEGAAAPVPAAPAASAPAGPLPAAAAGGVAIGGPGDAALAAPGANPPAASLPWGPIALLGVAMMAMYIADSATSNWSAVFLDDELGASGSVAALGLFFYQTFMVLGRAVNDRLVRRFGPARIVRVGAVIGGLGLVVVTVAPVPAIGLAGYALQGLGLCVVVPLSFSAAGRLDPGGTGVAIARVNLFNYAGFVIGAGLIGAVAELADLRLAFAVPALLTLVIVALARSFEVDARPAPLRASA
ncbi:MFS transporter [Virgisporangium aurantiacum]|uniref:MFS transporter n=1 Tax=Virgisporangium aurantiacum TaxID=175570 RepID=A0A8J3ZGY6_9ACTN|nr:MFS transporter [Virgisporangium aurantiacum]